MSRPPSPVHSTWGTKGERINASHDAAVVIGGSGFIGSSVVRRLLGEGRPVTVIDRNPPRAGTHAGSSNELRYLECDVMTDELAIPDGLVYLFAGSSQPHARRKRTLIADNVIATARLAGQLSGRSVVLASSIEVYGAAAAPLTETSIPVLPVSRATIDRWAEEAIALATEPCPDWRIREWCEGVIDAIDSPRWTYGVSKVIQESVVAASVQPEHLTILRLANLIGPGQTRVVAKLVHAAKHGLAIALREDTTRTFVDLERVVDAAVGSLGGGVFNVGSHAMTLVELGDLVRRLVGEPSEIATFTADAEDSCGVVDEARLTSLIGPDRDADAVFEEAIKAVANDPNPLFSPPIRVVIPPRPERPDVIASRTQRALHTGMLKSGGPWTKQLESRARTFLDLDDGQQVFATASGTAALRLAFVAADAERIDGREAILPSYTFAATAESLRQLGYRLRFVDIDPDTWTIDPMAVDAALAERRASLVVAVDALGNPADYDALGRVCERHGVPLIADSAPSIGARYQGRPVGSQAKFHTFSMSFAKTVSSGGAGGLVVVPREVDLTTGSNWLRSSQLHELHAAIALDQIDELEAIVVRRRSVAAIYRAAAAHWGDVRFQLERDGDQHAYVHWVVDFTQSSSSRDTVADRLLRLGVETKPYYSPPLHLTDLAEPDQARLPITETLIENCLTLPTSSEMTNEMAERVVMAMDRAIRG